MHDATGGALGIFALLLGLWVVLWLYFLLPAGMARNRNRSAFIWVLISLVGSPFLAVLLLLALGERAPGGPGR